MAAERQDPPRPSDPQEATDSGRPETGSGEGRRDVAGHIPDNIRVDPDITEGHPGYEESGDSEIIPSQQPSAPPKK